MQLANVVSFSCYVFNGQVFLGGLRTFFIALLKKIYKQIGNVGPYQNVHILLNCL